MQTVSNPFYLTMHPFPGEQNSWHLQTLPQFGFDQPMSLIHNGGMIGAQSFEAPSMPPEENTSNSSTRKRKGGNISLPPAKRPAIELALSENMSKIFHLAKEGNLAGFKAALNAKNIKEADNQGNTILHGVVADQLPVRFIDAIMKKGGYQIINTQNKDGNTPLHLGVQTGITRIIQKLLECGADRTIKNKAGQIAEKTNTAKNVRRFFNDLDLEAKETSNESDEQTVEMDSNGTE